MGRDVVYWVLGATGAGCTRTGFVGDDCATNPSPGCDPSFDTTRPVARLSGPAGLAVPTHAWIGGSLRGPLVGTALAGALPGGSDFVIQTPLAAGPPTESALLGGSASDRPLVLGQRDGSVVGLFSGQDTIGNALELYALGGPPSSLGSAGSALVRRGLMTTPDAMPDAGIVGGAMGRCAPTFTNVDQRGCAATAMVDPTATDSDGFWATIEPNGVVLGTTFGTSGRNEITAGAWVTADEIVLAGLADSAAVIGNSTLSPIPAGTSRVFLTRFPP